jgi:4-hydroxy-tetrahydrodipicolinate reductase
MITIILCGAAGRMGREIITAARACDDIKIIAGIEASGNECIGKKISDIAIEDDITKVIQSADCVVDFTNHTATIETLKKIKRYKKPFVTGTTGFSEKEFKDINEVSKEFPLLWSPNMSMGVNYLYTLVKSTTTALLDYDVEIIETHHKAKKDAPSGTAKAIANIVKGVRPETKFTYGREGMIGERKRGEVCIHAVRGGDVAGEHRVLFFGEGEFLELRHYATSRRCFAVGALAAVRFIVDKPPGLYSIQDILKS